MSSPEQFIDLHLNSGLPVVVSPGFSEFLRESSVSIEPRGIQRVLSAAAFGGLSLQLSGEELSDPHEDTLPPDGPKDPLYAYRREGLHLTVHPDGMLERAADEKDPVAFASQSIDGLVRTSLRSVINNKYLYNPGFSQRKDFYLANIAAIAGGTVSGGGSQSIIACAVGLNVVSANVLNYQRRRDVGERITPRLGLVAGLHIDRALAAHALIATHRFARPIRTI